MDEIKAGENRPSEVFLALWYYRTKREPLSAENFKLCAETWRKLLAMEEEPRIRVEPFQLPTVWEDLPAAVEAAAAAAAGGPDRTPKETGSEPEARKAAEAVKARSDAGAKGLATRKRNVRAALEELRAAGVKLQTIADADQRLDIRDVLQMLEARPVSLPVLAALERAVSVLRARAAGPSEEDMT